MPTHQRLLNRFEGYVQRVNQEAILGSQGVPVFGATVVVKKLPNAARDRVHVGMSVMLEVIASTSRTLAVPLKAVQWQKGVACVQVETASGRLETRPIKTGLVVSDWVGVVSGLRQGEWIDYHA